jgi:hypothetical protein
MEGRRSQFIIALVVGFAVFAVGFRWTAEVIPILGGLFGIAAVAGAVTRHPLLWGIGLGIGTRIVSLLHLEPALSPEHVAKYGKSQPLPLPFGLTDSAVAQALVGSLLIMSFPLVGACLGAGTAWLLGTERNGPAARGVK